MRVVQKVCSLTQSATTDVLDLFNSVSCYTTDMHSFQCCFKARIPLRKKLLYLVFQPAIYRAYNVLIVSKFVLPFILEVIQC